MRFIVMYKSDDGAASTVVKAATHMEAADRFTSAYYSPSSDAKRLTGDKGSDGVFIGQVRLASGQRGSIGQPFTVREG